MRRTHKHVVAIGAAAVVLAVARPAAGFLNDMAGHWAGSLVGALEAHGIVSGDESGRFHPEAPLTRAQLAKLLVTGLGDQDDAGLLAKYPSRFSDVASWHWAKGYIESLAEAGNMTGYPDGTFGPNDTVTRAQLAVIFVRAAGLSDQAQTMRSEPSGYSDDASIPDWARGAVNVARATGLLAGFEDNTFKPLDPVKRAEGSTAIFRLLELKGNIFHLSGTLVRFDATALTGTVRDDMGQEHSVTMSPTAHYYRGGTVSYAAMIRPLDQVWIVLGPDGKGSFMDARYSYLLVKDIQIQGPSVKFALPDGSARTMTLEPGVLTFLNGRPANPGDIHSATDAYLVLDRQTDEIRVLDALKVAASGTVVGYDSVQNKLVLQIGGSVEIFPMAKDAIVVVNGQRTALTDLQPDDRAEIARGDDGSVTYVLAER